MVELYSDQDLAALTRRIKSWTVGLTVLGAVALGVCITLAAVVTTGNALAMETAAVTISTLTGWVLIYGGVFVVRDSRRELSHAQMLREEARERIEGQVTVTREGMRLRKSITVRRVEVRQGENVRRLLVCESRAKALAAARPLVLYTAHGYVAAYEELPCEY